MKKTFLLLGALAALAAFGKYETPVNWIYRDGEGTSVTNMASYFDGDNWEGGMPPNAGSVSAYFPSVSGVKYVRFDQNVTLGGAVAMGPAQDRDLTSTPRLVLVSDAHVLDTCSAVNGSSYPIESIDLYADLDHADWSYFTSLCLAGDTLHDGTMVLAWGTFCHHLDWYAKTAGGARTNALAAAELYQGSGWISLYSPESSATNVTGRWSGRAGSAFLHRTGNNHVLPSGTLVHGAGIPEGTFLKRVFTRTDVELSQPLTADLDGDVTFDAQTARAYQHFDRHSLYSTSASRLLASKYRAEDDFVIDVGIENSAYSAFTVLYTSERTWQPATIRVHDGTRMKKVQLERAHLEFVEAGEELENGYPSACVALTGTGFDTRVTVGGDLAASFLAITNLEHALVKDGTGTLRTGLRSFKSNAGGLTVREGTLAVSNLVADAQETMGAVTVAAGATLRLEGLFRCATLAVEAGANLVIPAGSRLEVASGVLSDRPAFTGGGEIIYSAATGRNDPPIYESPEAKVAGVPAFWVDACTLTNAVPAGVIEVEEGTSYVSRWNDCRSAAEGGTHFATNRWLRPWLVTNGVAGPYVKIAKDTTSDDLQRALVWDLPITNIRHVFYVLDPSDGGGTVLGNTSDLTPDFARGGVDKNNDIFYSGGPNAYVVNATIYLDGVKTNRTAKLLNAATPTILEVPLAGPAKANAFGTIFWNTLRKDLSGNARIHEYVIYTNELTHAERASTLAYLWCKWKGVREAAYTTFPEDGDFGTMDLANCTQGVSTEAGEGVGVSGLAGTGTFVKAGAGDVYLTDATNAAADVRVEAGTLTVRSRAIDLVNPVDDTYLHVDASQTNTLTWKRVDGIDRITEWRDTENGRKLTPMTSSSTNQPRVRLAALNGRAMVDFGPAMGGNYVGKDQSPLSFTGSLKLQTIFSVLDTAGGGGALLGGSAGRNDTPREEKFHGLWRDVQSWPSWYQQPLIMGTSKRTFEGKNLNESNTTADYVDLTKTQVRLNQELVDQANTGFTGGFDMFSVRSTSKMRSNLLGGIHYGGSFGGMSYGEVIYYERCLSGDEVGRVERYLANKWFNRTSAMWRPAELGVVTVASGAGLCVEGGAPLTVKGISGAGAIDGDVTVSAGGELVAEAAGGAFAVPTVSGALVLPAAGTLRVTGDVASLAQGRHVLISGVALAGGSTDGWTIDAPKHPQRSYRLVFDDGTLKLDVFKVGTALILR